MMNSCKGPQLVIWILTARCDQSCIHCYTSKFSPGNELSESHALRLLSEMGDCGVRHIGFSGGRIFLREETLRLIERASELGMSTSIVANGIDMAREVVVKELANIGTFVLLSIDGANKETHEKVRGLGTWNYISPATENLRKFSVNFATVMALNKLNWRETTDYLSLAQELGALAGCLIPVMPAGRAGKELVLEPQGVMSTLQRVEEKAEELRFPVSLWCMPFAGLVVDSDLVHYDFCRNSEEMDLEPQGNVLLCDMMDIKPSSVGDRSFLQAWQEQQESSIVESVTHPQLAPPCLECPFRDKCRGGCFARAQLMSGDVRAPDPLCPRVAGLIK